MEQIGVINNKCHSGFRLTFSNGLTISVQFGSGNYCDNRTFFGLPTENFDVDMPTLSRNAEVAIWNQSGQWFNFGSDTVKGYVAPDEIAKWIADVSKAKTLNDIKYE